MSAVADHSTAIVGTIYNDFSENWHNNVYQPKQPQLHLYLTLYNINSELRFVNPSHIMVHRRTSTKLFNWEYIYRVFYGFVGVENQWLFETLNINSVVWFAVLKAILYISVTVAIQLQKFNINSFHHSFTHSRSIAGCITVSSTTVQTFKPIRAPVVLCCTQQCQQICRIQHEQSDRE